MDEIHFHPRLTLKGFVYMAHLSLVKKLSYLQEEQRHTHIYLEIGGIKLLRGSLAEFVGETSAGKTSLAFMLLSSLTQNGEICAVVDTNNSFDPLSAKKCGMELENILWLRCGGNIEHAFKTVDYLIQAKNFGMIWLDLGDSRAEKLNFIPSSYWYRFRTRIKGSPTVLVATANRSLMGAASNQAHHLDKHRIAWSGIGRFKLIKELRAGLNTSKPFFVKPEPLVIEAGY